MLTQRVIFENEFYKIEAVFGLSLVRVQWHSAISDAELRAGALKLRGFLMESGLQNLLSNSHHLASLQAATKDWLASTYYNSLSQSKLKKLARIMPANLFHQIALESVVTRAEAAANLSFLIRNFSDEEEAMKWLQD